MEKEDLTLLAVNPERCFWRVVGGVPDVIIEPGSGDLLGIHGKVYHGVPVWFLGLAQELHARLFGGSPPLFPVAGVTTGDNVGPRGFASPGTGNNVIIGQVLRFKNLSAILTAVLVPDIDVSPGELDFLAVVFDITGQPKHGRKIDGR